MAILTGGSIADPDFFLILRILFQRDRRRIRKFFFYKSGVVSTDILFTVPSKAV